MEIPNLVIGQILSWIRRWMELATAGARAPRLAAVANYAAALPVDMLHDIMLRLPADEVCRMRPVCRTWRSLTFDPHFARAHASRHPQPHVIVVRHDDGGAAEVRDVDLHGNVIKSRRIRRPIGPLSVHGDLLCASHGWGLTSVVDMVTGAVADVGVDPRKKVNSATPYCVLGHVPATGEYKVLRIQADYCCRPWRQRCDVVTLGASGDAGSRWRRRTCPPVTLRLERPWPSSRNVAVVAGLAYFLVDELDVEADRLAVFDLATEEWKPATLQGPLTSSILASADDEEEVDDEDDELIWQPIIVPAHDRPYLLLRRTHFQVARLGESLVVVYCNVKDGSTELWFLEDMEDDPTARWSKRYTLQCTPFGDDESSPQYHYPLAVLDDGRILVWVDWTSALRAYDPKTCAWTDLATLTGDCVVGMHHGSLLCSNVGQSGLELVGAF